MASGKLAGLPIRLVWVLAFVLITVVGFSYLWTQSGGALPGVTTEHYRVVFHAKDVKNLQERGDVRIAGVQVGSVTSLSGDGHGMARVEMDLTKGAPLHQGAKVRVGLKSVIGLSEVHITDGRGPELSSGTTLPDSAVVTPVDIDEVVKTFDPKTRQELSGAVKSLGAATQGTGKDLGQLMNGLGNLGRDGNTALDALAAQSEDLSELTRETPQMLDALDTGRGRIADVVQDTQRLTAATSGQREALQNTIRALPTLLDNANTATGKLGELGSSLGPVAANLRAAAPNLNTALMQLPATTRDLRGLLPSLNGTLDSAPATLNRVEPALGSDLRATMPTLHTVLRNVNPMLQYLKPYGRDIGSFFDTFAGSFDLLMGNGVRAVRLDPIFNQESVRNVPTPLLSNLNPQIWHNAYPKPGGAVRPEPFQGQYPRIHRDN